MSLTRTQALLWANRRKPTFLARIHGDRTKTPPRSPVSRFLESLQRVDQQTDEWDRALSMVAVLRPEWYATHSQCGPSGPQILVTRDPVTLTAICGDDDQEKVSMSYPEIDRLFFQIHRGSR